jgi:serine/threonine protein phosphatase 1
MAHGHWTPNKVFGQPNSGDKTRVRTLAVGDIHGCLNSLGALMECVELNAGDRLILLGDYIDRGPDSRGVVDWTLATRKTTEVITLRGNHEEMMMTSRNDAAHAHFWASVGGLETLESYGADFGHDWVTAVPEPHWQFFEQTRLYFETDKHIFVHGMVNDEKTMADQDPYLMVWTKCFGMKPHRSGKPVICGHTAHKDGNIGVYDFGFCIDTAACKGGWLTCLNPDTGEFWQANEKRETRFGRVA